MTDTLFLAFTFLTITLSISSYYWGKYKARVVWYQKGWLDGMSDGSTMETSLRNKINDLEETIKRFTVEMIPTPPTPSKKRGRPSLRK